VGQAVNMGPATSSAKLDHQKREALRADKMGETEVGESTKVKEHPYKKKKKKKKQGGGRR